MFCWEDVCVAVHAKGEIISKCFFLAEDSSKKQTKTRCILVKTNSFVRFLEESLTWQFAFEINWPLRPHVCRIFTFMCKFQPGTMASFDEDCDLLLFEYLQKLIAPICIYVTNTDNPNTSVRWWCRFKLVSGYVTVTTPRISCRHGRPCSCLYKKSLDQIEKLVLSRYCLQRSIRLMVQSII